MMLRATVIVILVALVALQVCAQHATASPLRNELYPYEPLAQKSAFVTVPPQEFGQVRFTVLTPVIIRMEFQAAAHKQQRTFVDQATLAIVNRHVAKVPDFQHSFNGPMLQITTSAIQLMYNTSMPFSSASLQITPVDKSKSAFNGWYWGKERSGQQMGTIRGLDGLTNVPLNCTQIKEQGIFGNAHESLHCEWGLISREGWVAVDDSENYLLDDNAFWTTKNPNDVDTYFMAHGHDYRQALMDWRLLSGAIAMVPRYMSGIMWSRWYDYNTLDVQQVVDAYADRSIPLDFFILDMDWHTKHAWTGYTWDRQLLPYPRDTMDGLHRRGLHTAANIHDDQGIGTWEESFGAMHKALGTPVSDGAIPMNLISSKYDNSLEDITMQDIEKDGMDVWWIDWQQGGKQGGTAGGKQNPTFWTAKMRGTDPIRRGQKKRGVVLARWGGLGAHRYQIGFSGDVNGLTWQNLAYQPYFSQSAVNVGYGYWSHDIVGLGTDHELHVRWIQWAAYSGAFRTHDRGGSAGGCNSKNFPTRPDNCWIVRPWQLPNYYYGIARQAMVQRAELLPYIYTHQRLAFETGLSLMRPMYYGWPEEDQAYKADREGNWPQYMWGDDMLIAPITVPTNQDFLAPTSLWLPSDTMWIERSTGCIIHSSSSSSSSSQDAADANSDEDDKPHFLHKAWSVSDIPIFIRQGAVIPTLPLRRGDTIGVAQRQYSSLTWSIYPGQNQGRGEVYEDNGHDIDYLKSSPPPHHSSQAGRTWRDTSNTRREETPDGFAWTELDYNRQDASTIQIKLATRGSYATMSKSRTYTIRLVNTLPVQSIDLDVKTQRNDDDDSASTMESASVPWSRWGGVGTWSYDGPAMTVVIELPVIQDITGGRQILLTVRHDAAVSSTSDDAGAGGDLSCMRGVFSGAQASKHVLDEIRKTPGSQTGDDKRGALKTLSSVGESLSLLAGGEPKRSSSHDDADADATADDSIDVIDQDGRDEFYKLLKSVQDLHQQAMQEVASLKGYMNDHRLTYSQTLLTNGLEAMHQQPRRRRRSRV